MENIICNRSEDIDLLTPYIDKPVYIKGIRWNRIFDGWTVIYNGGANWLRDVNLVFDYRGKTYPVFGFLPSRLYLQMPNSSNGNAIYKREVL